MNRIFLRMVISWFVSKLLVWGVPMTMKMAKRNTEYFHATPAPPTPLEERNPWKPDVAAGPGLGV